MWFVSEYNAARTRQIEPTFEPHHLRLKDIWPAEQIPEFRLTCMKDKVANPGVYSVDRVWLVDLDESRVCIAAAVLKQGSIAKPLHRRSLAHPFLEGRVSSQLVQVMALAAESHPPADSCRIAQSP